MRQLRGCSPSLTRQQQPCLVRTRLALANSPIVGPSHAFWPRAGDPAAAYI